jgi:hypothetical protein
VNNGSKRPLRERLEDKVDRSAGPSKCHLWQAATKKGYGQIMVWVDGRKRMKQAHRVAYELKHGPVPRHLDVCHKCDVRHCVNVRHLFVGTRKQNIGDALDKGRMKGGRKRHTGILRAHLSEIRRCLKAGESAASVARKFGVTRAAVGQIRAGRTYRGIR